MPKNLYDNRSTWSRHPWFWSFFLIILGISLLIGLGYVSFQLYTSYKYAHATLEQPNMSDEHIKEWATKIAQQSYTYNYKNYETELLKLKPYFTPSGWDAFDNALKLSKNLDVVKANKFSLSTTAIPERVRVLENKFDKESKRYEWKLEVPITVLYKGKEHELKQLINLQMTIMRIPKTAANSDGVAINAFIAISEEDAK